jgi:dihydrofolate reductase
MMAEKPEVVVTIVRLQITMSLDGYVAGPNQSLEHPLGERGEELHQWAFAARSFREMHGMEGGDTGPDSDIIAEAFQNVGAYILGRNMFGGGPGPWQESWRGWWGDNPPYHTPVFVLTHHAREPLEMLGGTTFHFVTEGIHAALDRAKDAAGEKDVAIAGGADIVQQYLKAGLIDEMEIHVVPPLLGSGSRLFENMDSQQSRYECIRVVSSPAVTHVKYRLR